MTPAQASKTANEKLVFTNLQNRRLNNNQSLNWDSLLELQKSETAERVFSKGDSTNWSYQIYTITEVIHDTIPSYRINYLSER